MKVQNSSKSTSPVKQAPPAINKGKGNNTKPQEVKPQPKGNKNSKAQGKDHPAPNKQATETKGNSPKEKSSPANGRNSKTQDLKHIVVSGQILSWAECGKIASIDSRALSSNEKAYVNANQFQYYVACNVWGNILIPKPDFGSEALFRNWLMTDGLHKAVLTCHDVASQFIDMLDCEGSFVTPRMIGLEWDRSLIGRLIGECPVGEVLMKLRFLDRFSPTKADKLEQKTMEKFKAILHDTNWGLVEKESTADPGKTEPKLGVWGDYVKEFLHAILKDFVLYYRESSCRFSGGNCTDGKNLVEKVAALSCCMASIDGLPLDGAIRKYGQNQYRNIPVGTYIKGIREKKGDARKLFIPEVGPVPKNLRGYRVIGPESAYVSFNMQRVREAAEKCISNSKYAKLFDVKTQDPNRVAARDGSIDRIMITVDLKSASDREARHVMRQLLPTDVWDILEEFLPVAINVCGKLFPPSIFLTSGNPATFILLGILVLSCALAAQKLHKAYFPREKTIDPIVFGDDAVIDVRYSEEFFSILEHLGLVVNYDKTFLGHYRESCGVEYVDGYPTTTDYWPRKTVRDPRGNQFKVEDFTSLVKLQHRLYHNDRARWFLNELVWDLYPKMTTSEIGEDSDDLWSEFLYTTDFPIRRAPMRSGGVSCKAEDLPYYMQRRRHVCVKATKDPKWDKLDGHALSAIESYMLYRYLVTGPQYADDFSKLLGVTEPRREEMEAYKPINTLGTTVR